MPTLKYTPEFFGSYWGVPLSQEALINFTWDELCKAAITVGRRSWDDVLMHGNYSVLEVLWRLAILRANLVEDRTGNLQPSKAFKDLDPSEKGAVSFFLGMCFTKLIVEKLFGVPWLLHLDVYSSILNPSLAFSSRPDFVGLDAHQQWVIVESKGRSWGMPKKTMEKAKHQTRCIRNIHGNLPVLRVAIGSHFSTKNLNAKVWDPDEYEENAEDLDIDSDHLIRAYYRPLVQYFELHSSFSHSQDYTQEKRQQVGLIGLDASISIDDEILAWYDSEETFWDSIIASKVDGKDSILNVVAAFKHDVRKELALPEQEVDQMDKEDHEVKKLNVNLDRKKQISKLIEKQRSSDIGKSIDGVTVELGESWQFEYMRRQPQDRKG